MFGIQSPPARRPAAGPKLDLERLDGRVVPAVIAGNNDYFVGIGQSITRDAKNGILSDDFSDDNEQAILVAGQISRAVYTADPTQPQPVSGKFPAFPQNLIRVNSNGSFSFTAPDQIPAGAGGVQFTYKAIDTTQSNAVSNTATVTIRFSNATGGAKLFAVATGPGIQNQVRVFDAANGLEKFSLFPYESTFTGGVRVATGDVTADGIDDIVVVPASGGSVRLKVYDGKDGVLISDTIAFEPTFRGGATVSIGDVDGRRESDNNLYNDIIVGAGDGGGPRVTVFNSFAIKTGTLASNVYVDFFAYEQSFRNGVNVAAGNIGGFPTGDLERRDYIVTGAGNGGGPVVKVFDGRSINSLAIPVTGVSPRGPQAAQTSEPPPLTAFFAYNSSQRGGVNVAVGRFGTTDAADIVTGQGSGQALVRVFDGRNASQLREFTVANADNPTGGTTAGSTVPAPSLGASNFTGGSNPGSGLVVTTGGGGTAGGGGVRVAVIPRDDVPGSDIVTGLGPSGAPRVRIYNGNSLAEVDSQLAFQSNFLGGVFVGGNSL